MADSLDAPACLDRVRRRDEAAARELVAHLWPLVIKIVRAHLPRALDEEDLAQEIFMKVFANLEQFRGEVPVEHWVSRVAVSTCLDRLRAQKRRPEWRWADLGEAEAEVLEAVLHNESEPHPSQGMAARELAVKLLDSLGAEDRLVIHLLDLEQRPVAEIAQVVRTAQEDVARELTPEQLVKFDERRREQRQRLADRTANGQPPPPKGKRPPGPFFGRPPGEKEGK